MSVHINFGNSGHAETWITLEELHGHTFGFLSVAVLHFKTGPCPLWLFRRTLQQHFQFWVNLPFNHDFIHSFTERTTTSDASCSLQVHFNGSFTRLARVL